MHVILTCRYLVLSGTDM